MARKFLTPLDLGQLELQNAAIQNLSADPSSPVAGQAYFNTSSKTLKLYTGTSWLTLGTLDQVTAAAGDIALGTHKITGLGDPSAAQDAATKNYVDNLVNGLDWKNPVRAASTANVTVASALVNGATIDGVTVATGDRVLLKDQSTPRRTASTSSPRRAPRHGPPTPTARPKSSSSRSGSKRARPTAIRGGSTPRTRRSRSARPA
jgi:hypothetical protein